MAALQHRRFDEQPAGAAHAPIEEYPGGVNQSPRGPKGRGGPSPGDRHAPAALAMTQGIMATFTVDQILQAVRSHLAPRTVVTLATSHRDEPWAATAFYVARGHALYVCQRKRARTPAHTLAHPRPAIAVDAHRADDRC